MRPVELLLASLVPLLCFAVYWWHHTTKEKRAKRAREAFVNALADRMQLTRRDSAGSLHGVFADRTVEIVVRPFDVWVVLGLRPGSLPRGLLVTYSPGPRGGLQQSEDERMNLVARTGDEAFDARFLVSSLDGRPASAHAERIGAATRSTLVGIVSEMPAHRSLAIDHEALRLTVGWRADDTEGAVAEVTEEVEHAAKLAEHLERALA